MRQNSRRRFGEKCEVADDAFNSMMSDDLLDIEDDLKSPLVKFITFSANDCV